MSIQKSYNKSIEGAKRLCQKANYLFFVTHEKRAYKIDTSKRGLLIDDPASFVFSAPVAIPGHLARAICGEGGRIFNRRLNETDI